MHEYMKENKGARDGGGGENVTIFIDLYAFVSSIATHLLLSTAHGWLVCAVVLPRSTTITTKIKKISEWQIDTLQRLCYRTMDAILPGDQRMEE